MKMKKALRKLLAMCMAVMSILFIMPNTISYAEQSSQTGDTITCKIKEFDMGNKAFQIELSTNASGCGIAHYQYNYYSQGSTGDRGRICVCNKRGLIYGNSHCQ